MESRRTNYGQFVWTGVVAAALAATTLYHLGAPKKVLFEENHHVEISLGHDLNDFVDDAPELQNHVPTNAPANFTLSEKQPSKRHPSSTHRL